VDNLSSGRIENLTASADDPRLTFLEEDIQSSGARSEMISFHPDVLFHLAAHVDVGASVVDPLGDARINVIGSLSVLESARLAGARKIVFTSSGGTIYGNQETFPIKESAPVDPHSPYAASKIAGEVYLTVYRHLYGIQTTTLALGNVYGPRQDPHGETGVISIFASALLEGRSTAIFGTGDDTRDYVYIDDVVHALELAAGHAGNGLRLNIGTGRETSVRALHRVLAEFLERPDEPTFLPPRAGELHRVALDSTAAARVLGWRPGIELPEGIARTVAWLRNTVTSGEPNGGRRHDAATAEAISTTPAGLPTAPTSRAAR
jgi:UDP-glucose 4-epimerase